MKGFTRKIDDLGRLVLPKEMRTACGIGINEPVEMELTAGGILVRPAMAHCATCGGVRNLVAAVNGSALCRDCLDSAYADAYGREIGKAAL